MVDCTYRSPSSDLCPSTNALCDLLCRVQVHSHVLICGYPDINNGLNGIFLVLVPVTMCACLNFTLCDS